MFIVKVSTLIAPTSSNSTKLDEETSRQAIQTKLPNCMLFEPIIIRLKQISSITKAVLRL